MQWQFLFYGTTGFCWPVAYFATTSADSGELALLFWEAVEKLDDYGFTVDYLMTDGASQNRGLFNLLCNGNARQAGYSCVDFFDITHKIYLVQDPKHCLKKIRNSIESSRLANTGRKRKLCKDGNCIVWDHWIQAHNFNQSLGITKHAKLTSDHIYLTNELKMRNHLAEQVLNRDMLLLMKTYQQSLPLEKRQAIDSSIELLEMTSELVDIFMDETRQVKTSTNDTLKRASDVLQYFLAWENSTPDHKKNICLITKESREDLQSCIQGFLAVSQLCMSLDAPLKPGIFNSDIIENFFCQQRGIVHGLNTNPTVAQYGPGVNSIILGQGSVSKKGNAGKSTLSLKSIKPNVVLNKTKKVKTMRF